MAALSVNPRVIVWENVQWASFYQPLFLYALYLFGDGIVVDCATADDLVSEAFLKVMMMERPLECPDDREPNEFLRSYLAGIMRHRAYEKRRRDKKLYRGYFDAPQRSTVENRIYIEELVSKIPKRIKSRRYSEAQLREVIMALMQTHTGRTNQEISELLDLPIEDVRNILRLIREVRHDE